MKNNKRVLRTIAIICAVAMAGSVLVSMLYGVLGWL